MVETEKGRIAVGWLIVEDLAMVLALVLLPALFGGRGDEANGAGLLQSAGIVALKVVGFVAFMLIVARRILPAVLHWTAHTGSRELFRLAVLAIALGVAFRSEEHTSELQSLMRISYAVFCLKKKKTTNQQHHSQHMHHT